jgi:hypothetical protein
MDLYRNKIGNRGGQALADAMGHNVHVMDLNITYNRISTMFPFSGLYALLGN